MCANHPLDDFLGAHVARNVLDLVAGAGELRGRRLELLRPTRRNGQPVTLLTQQPRDRQSDAAGPAGHDRGSLVLA